MKRAVPALRPSGQWHLNFLAAICFVCKVFSGGQWEVCRGILQHRIPTHKVTIFLSLLKSFSACAGFVFPYTILFPAAPQNCFHEAENYQQKIEPGPLGQTHTHTQDISIKPYFYLISKKREDDGGSFKGERVEGIKTFQDKKKKALSFGGHLSSSQCHQLPGVKRVLFPVLQERRGGKNTPAHVLSLAARAFANTGIVGPIF